MHETLSRKGLYDPRFEHDACGVGFIADLNNVRSHEIVEKGIEILVNLDHRGARGAEKESGDGAGILTQIPHAFFLRECSQLGITLPEPGDYGIGQCFLPRDTKTHVGTKHVFRRALDEVGLDVLGWREVPTDSSTLGATAISGEPAIQQVIVRRPVSCRTQDDFERRLFVARKYGIRMVRESVKGADDFYICSLSSRTVVYKGMLTPEQVPAYFPDLSEESFESALALIHSRFSTNTLPTWPLAHPFRTLAHNGEINTLRGNVNWMRSREALIESSLFTADEIQKMRPVAQEGSSDSGILDNVVEFLMMGGRSLPHVMMMLIPEAWEKDPEISADRKAFYEYNGAVIEPWDGPASVAFTDGTLIGATLDRNGLRPSRYCLTDDNILIMASEAGVLEVPPEKVVRKGRLQPGKMFVASLEEGRIIPDEEIKSRICAQQPYQQWLDDGKIPLAELEPPRQILQPPARRVLTRQKVFGYSLEDLRILMAPMVKNGQEPVGSMGNDTPLAVLSEKSRSLFDYFHQLFAQVTNPPIDPIREEMVMSLVSFVGGEGNILVDGPEHAHMIELPQPVLTNEDLERLRWVDRQHFQAKTISTCFKAEPGRMQRALDRLRREAEEYVLDGYEVIILTDRPVDSDHAAIPSLLAVSAVHHHLIRKGLRSRCGLVVETGEAREVHHFACLLGFGASAVNPYVAFETIEDMRLRKLLPSSLSEPEAREHYLKAVGKGLLKTMSKMGISTISSYIGAQIFEAVGLADEVIEEYFPGTVSRIGGIDVGTIERETLMRHQAAYIDVDDQTDLELGGLYQWRLRGERHLHNPDTIQKLQHAARTNDYELYREYARLIDDNSEAPITVRHLLEFANLTPIPIEEVEPVESIVKRFATGAMSFGSISWEAHTTLAIAMNRLGAKSNTGEGGEDPARFEPLPNGDSMRSAIKQVASGRFGVTSNYLVNADELQIKMAQGAKPGEGGQLPGHKVDEKIAKTRHSTPGVGLISPPPHHDIYSIEDLAQLIYDLKNSNPRARINVKLVAEVGVGTIAAGVAKAHADVILISGHDGGTGASPLSSIKHAGLPWELGLAEAHQVLMQNNLRDRVVLQTDGLLRTGRDIAIATLLGAEEWGVATGALVAMGCIMMRKCHLNTCPVGVATQDEELRKLFTGDPDHVVNFFRFIAADLREHMARLGFRRVDDMVGRVDRIAPLRDVRHFKAKQLDLSRLLHFVRANDRCGTFCCVPQDHGLDRALDNELVRLATPALERGESVEASFEIRNVNRTVGTILGQEITRRTGEEGLPEDTIRLKATGSAGQSFMAFAPRGLTIELEGEANDYFCKGLSGGKAILRPPRGSVFNPNENVICGNVSFYGATSGKAFILGPAGERFCVRNSGAHVVVEGVGDHGCEYMTGGRAVVLGPIGRNFAAGMSGGVAYVWDEDERARPRVNTGMVDLEDMAEPDDVLELRALVEEHARATGSERARRILATWEVQLRKFVKVMPRDYKRAQAKRAAETAAVA
ncbi:MAG: glutamate synthase large subunit [Acidobacteria bacterium]|jgi:glutamate synthase domain-containing protein 2/glutamate synthase domain-containing protein 1/glutamate synthase domain-containing protein 3|nr:glutamate synthase large subunit [Acidobacteriota bacterium]